MCSVGDDNYEEQHTAKYLPSNEPFRLRENKCNKCRLVPPNVVLRSKDVYCKNCFLAAVTHKFKALLGKHRLIRPNDRVLIDHRKGHASTALLHFLRSGLDLNTPKKLRFSPVFIHIEDNTQCEEIGNLLKEQVGVYKFPFHSVSLTQFIAGGIETIENASPDCPSLQNDLNNLNVSLTNYDDYLRIKRQNLLLEMAKKLDCKCVFTNELSVDIASQLLTNISLGRGIHLPLDVGICDDRDSDIKIIRPLRLFEIKELALYNHFNDLQPITTDKLQIFNRNSVQNLMRSFVTNLQTNFPATITTIVRTGDKLTMDKGILKNDKCALCMAPLENPTDRLNAAESTSFSHWVSTTTPDYDIPPVDRYKNTLESYQNLKDSEYCFACGIIKKFC